MNDLNLMITIFEHGSEAAEVQADLKPADLIGAILAEFGSELAYLSSNPAAYELQRPDGSALDAATTLGAQLVGETHLILAEAVPPPPAGAHPLTAPLYLREPASGTVFAIHWTPALIGRSDPKLPDEALLAVNLSGRKHADRVSRRHARISGQNGTPVLEPIANNPIIIRRGADAIQLTKRYPLQAGDVIVLEYSAIQLQVLQRNV